MGSSAWLAPLRMDVWCATIRYHVGPLKAVQGIGYMTWRHNRLCHTHHRTVRFVDGCSEVRGGLRAPGLSMIACTIVVCAFNYFIFVNGNILLVRRLFLNGQRCVARSKQDCNGRRSRIASFLISTQKKEIIMGNCGFGGFTTWSLDSLPDCRIGLEFRWCRHEMLNEDDKVVAKGFSLCFFFLFKTSGHISRG